MYKVIKKYPGFFPGTKIELEKTFKWAYEFVIGRSFGWALPCSMIVPLADNLNHANVNVSYSLLHKDIHILGPTVKYDDFQGIAEVKEFQPRKKTCLNRLNKALGDGIVQFDELTNIWDINIQLSNYASSTDSEDNDSTSEEEEEEGSGEEESDEEESKGGDAESSSESEEEEYKWYDW
jgi:hypothetical protein